MIFSVFSTAETIPLGICSNIVNEDTDWITSTSQGLILPLMIRTKNHSLLLFGKLNDAFSVTLNVAILC